MDFEMADESDGYREENLDEIILNNVDFFSEIDVIDESVLDREGLAGLKRKKKVPLVSLLGSYGRVEFDQ